MATSTKTVTNKKKTAAPKQRNARAFVLVGLAGVAVGALATFLLLPSPSPTWLATTDPNATVSVTPMQFVDERQIATTPELSPEYEALSPASGVVRRADCAVGTVAPSGSAPFVVNDEPILLLHTEVPLWRDLELGMEGDDVISLETELARLGYLDMQADKYYGTATADAVRRLWASVGVADQRSIFMSSIVWLPLPEAALSKCPLDIGQQLAPGESLFTAGAGAESVTVKLPINALLGEREAFLGEIVTPLPESGIITDPEFLAAWARSRSFLEYQAGNATQVNINVRLVAPIEVVSVPASSLYNLAGAEGCVVSGGQPAAIRVIASQFGQTLVHSEPLPTSVLVNPENQASCR